MNTYERLEKLSPDTERKISSGEKGYSKVRGEQFLKFCARLEKEMLSHPVIVDNTYTQWFSKGEMSEEHVKKFIIQFSVFSNLFTIAQLKKVINADSLENMRASKEILVNELGVIFKPKDREHERKGHEGLKYDAAQDPELVSVEGTVEGSTFRFSAAHFEWLLRIAKELGLGFNDVGKRRNGNSSTLFFCDELSRLYGHENYEISQAASFAIENWAYRSGFWKELMSGLSQFQKRTGKKLSMGFFTYHDRLEKQHAIHTQEELEEYYFENQTLNEDQYIKHGIEILNAVEIFFKGLA